MNNYYDFTNEIIEVQKFKLADLMKTYALSQNKKIFNVIKFENDEAFLEPLLISHFFATKFKRKTLPLDSLLFGYFSTCKNEIPSNLSFNKDNIAFVPKIGYYEKILDKNKKLDYLAFKPQIKIKNSNIEIYRSIPQLLEFQFNNTSDNDQECFSPNFIEKLIKDKKSEIDKSLQIIKIIMPRYYSQIISVAKGVILFKSNKLVSFASRISPGIAYLNIQKEDKLIFFIVEMIHQFGHNIFYRILNSQKTFFKIHPDTLLRSLNNNQKEKRTLYSAFHGLFTTTKVATGLELMLNNSSLFNKEEAKEIIGRFADNKRRFRTGLEKMDLNEVFTPLGVKLYKMLDKECENIYKRNKHITDNLIVESQPFVYDHNLFLKENLYEVRKKLTLLEI
ncbi:hypothetical protein [Tenacibaculum sp. A30]|uniref:hypothetical protein n=1 Tax=Tenacibaculum sp. A30 TaxID=3442644 RepID=UPI003EBA6D2E